MSANHYSGRFSYHVSACPNSEILNLSPATGFAWIFRTARRFPLCTCLPYSDQDSGQKRNGYCQARAKETMHQTVIVSPTRHIPDFS